MSSDRQIPIENGLRIAHGPLGLRLVGEAEAILQFGNDLRALSTLESGTIVRLGEWKLLVDGGMFPNYDDRCVAYPAKAWGMAGGVFADASYGGEPSPIDFGDVGLVPRAAPDIGVCLLGITRYDWTATRQNRPEIVVPELWPKLSEHLERSNRGCHLYIGSEGWTADLLALDTGEDIVRGLSSDATLDQLVSKLFDRFVQ